MAMLIVCPRCATSYMIDPATLAPAGRMVRCARCKTAWHAGGATAASEVDSFVKDIIAEAQAQHTAPPSPIPPVAEPSLPRDRDRGLPAPDDFGDEMNIPVSAVGHDVPPAAADGFADGDAPAMPETAPIAMPDSPSIVPQISDVAAPDTAAAELEHDDIESFAARRARMQAKRKKTRRASKWTALVLVLLGFNIALIGARNDVVRFLPQTASLFAAVGLPVNLRGLIFENVKVLKEDSDGVNVLVIEGDIVSTARGPVEVPRLRFGVRNNAGQEIYSWTALATRSVLGSGERLPFRSRLASPPADAADIVVRFFAKQDVVNGGK